MSALLRFRVRAWLALERHAERRLRTAITRLMDHDA